MQVHLSRINIHLIFMGITVSRLLPDSLDCFEQQACSQSRRYPYLPGYDQSAPHQLNRNLLLFDHS